MGNFTYTGKSLASPSPAVTSLIRTLRIIPALQGSYGTKGHTLPRLQWRANGGLNRHDAGLALDIILFSAKESERIFAWRLADLFVLNKWEMGWSSFIYMDLTWGKSKDEPSPYTADKRHFDHIHIDWMDYAAYLETGKTGIPWSASAFTTGSDGGLLQSITDAQLNQVSSFDEWWADQQ